MINYRLFAPIGAAAIVFVATGAPAAFAEPSYPPASEVLAASECGGPTPYLAYQINSGESLREAGAPLAITFVNPDGEDYVIQDTMPVLGQQQTVLWPGASSEPDLDWPGWEKSPAGEWVKVSNDAGSFTTAAGGVTVQFGSPALSTTVSYASGPCTGPVLAASSDFVASGPTSVPNTGAPAVVPMVAAGIAALGAGAGLAFASRRRRA